jgi:hypothetical protein
MIGAEAIAAWLLLAVLVSTPIDAQDGPPVRVLPPGVAMTTEPLTSITQVRALSTGAILVNDGTRRRLVMFDSSLTSATVLADSALGFPEQYGTRIGVLMAYRSDSSFLMDAASLSMLVIDPSGRVVRTRAIPRSVDATRIATVYSGVDAQGGIIYRGLTPSPLASIPRGGGVSVPEPPDSAPVVRIDLQTRKLDTVARIKIPRSTMLVTQSSTGGITIRSTTNPIPVVDEWVVTSDGRLALIRGRDYHVDWLNTDGSRTSSPKMPFGWKRLEYEDKVRFLDSTKTAMETSRKRQMDLMIARYDSLSLLAQQGKAPAPPPLPPMDQYFGPMPTMPSPDQLPDYFPPFSASAVRADGDGNIWIRTNPMQPIPGGLVYDVVNRDGVLVDRIQVPTNRNVVGFGPGGAVYLSVRDAKGLHVERAFVPPRN